jgi:phosphatidylinositol alpha-1,6-mannosyltransferase
MARHNYNSVLFLTLKVFSATGGIEKVNRIVGKALYELGLESGNKAKVFSMYDKTEDIMDKYFPLRVFKGFDNSKIKFVYQSVMQGKKSNLVILSHINLLSVGYAIKLLSPDTKVYLITHGIEVWNPLPSFKKKMLQTCDLILPVSKFTKDTMIEVNGIPKEKFHIFNNCLDPFLPEPIYEPKSAMLQNRYGLSADAIVLMTLTRLSSKELYKGYDNVLVSLKNLIPQYPSLRYLIVGKYDAIEKKRLDEIIAALGITQYVVFAGFIPDEELALHYNLADVYVMPSKKEGFGIVFIEAMYYGKPVIAGNKDGSVDALYNGRLGILVNPDDKTEITDSIKKIIDVPGQFIPDHKVLIENFSYGFYKNHLKQILSFVQ